MNTKLLNIFCLCILAFVSLKGQTATYYVSTSGNNSNPGSSTLPFRTIQKAADKAIAGDSVIVRAGTYRERIEVKFSGTSGKYVTFQGELGATIDGGDIFTGWVPAPEIGAGVFKKSGLPYEPRNMTWNDKYILQINSTAMKDGRGKLALARSSSNPEWTGVEALFGTLNGITYLRFRNKLDPNKENIRFSSSFPGAFHLEGKSYVVVRGFTIKNHHNPIYIRGASNNNIIEKNTLVGGRASVYVMGEANQPALSPARNQIRNNQITLNYIYSDYGYFWKRTTTDIRIWRTFKELSTSDRTGISINNAGDDNQIYGNHVYKHHDGIIHADSTGGTLHNRRLKIYNNYIHNMQDSGIEALDGGVGVQWYDNIIYETTSPLRVKVVKAGPLYIYKNRVANKTQKSFEGYPAGEGFVASLEGQPNTSGVVYFYHNSIVIGGVGLDFTSTSPSTLGNPNFWFVNNIISSQILWGEQNFGTPKSHFDYNWGGGTIKSGWIKTLHNVLAPGRTLWTDRANTNFLLTSTSPVRARGIDLSKSWIVDGKTHPALPGMKTGYFSGTKPDLGAIQY